MLKLLQTGSFHYFSSPGLIWDAMLKITGVKLEKNQILTCTYSLKKDYKQEFLTLLRDILKQMTNT